MYTIINSDGDRLAHLYGFRFVDPSKKCWTWSKESSAIKVLDQFQKEGKTGLTVIKLDPKEESNKQTYKRGRKPKVQEDEFVGEPEYDEESFFSNGYHKKCESCQNLCKQSILVKIIRCPSFRKI